MPFSDPNSPSPSASRPQSTGKTRGRSSSAPPTVSSLTVPASALRSSPKISPPCWSLHLCGFSQSGSRARCSVRLPGGGRVVRQHSVKVVALLAVGRISTAHSQWFAYRRALSTRTGPWVLCFVFCTVLCRTYKEISGEMLSCCPICLRSLFAFLEQEVLCPVRGDFKRG